MVRNLVGLLRPRRQRRQPPDWAGEVLASVIAGSRRPPLTGPALPRRDSLRYALGIAPHRPAGEFPSVFRGAITRATRIKICGITRVEDALALPTRAPMRSVSSSTRRAARRRRRAGGGDRRCAAAVRVGSGVIRECGESESGHDCARATRPAAVPRRRRAGILRPLWTSFPQGRDGEAGGRSARIRTAFQPPRADCSSMPSCRARVAEPARRSIGADPLRLSLPVVLSGGLTPTTSARPCGACGPGPWTCRAASEARPGIKDAAKIAAFIRGVRNAGV